MALEPRPRDLIDGHPVGIGVETQAPGMACVPVASAARANRQASPGAAMIGRARFTYTDRDMIAALGAGWAGFARPRNLLVAYAIFAAFNAALGVSTANGILSIHVDPKLVIFGSAAEAVLTFGALLPVAWNRARRVLRSRYAFAWYADKLRGEQSWAWDGDALRLRYDRGQADLAWNCVGAWLDAPQVLLLYPPGAWALSVPAAGWREAPRVLLYPYGAFALVLPKRVLAVGDAGRLVDVLRAAGVPERRRFGLIAANSVG